VNHTLPGTALAPGAWLLGESCSAGSTTGTTAACRRRFAPLVRVSDPEFRLNGKDLCTECSGGEAVGLLEQTDAFPIV